MPTPHLLEVWDPADGQEHMHAHLRVLLNSVRQYRHERRQERDVHVWWGHLAKRSAPSPQAVTRSMQIPVESDRNDPALETHLYLTDQCSLYVAHLGAVTTEDPHRLRDGSVPHLYKNEHCYIWYRLWDIRRLVENDSVATAHALRNLRQFDDNAPLLPHRGLPSLPSVVSAEADARYFDPTMRQHFIQDQFWVEHDAAHSGIGTIERDLCDNCFGAEAWYSYGPLARSFIATGERLWRDHSRDAHFDQGMVVLEFAKALELQCNTIVRNAMCGAPAGVAALNVDGRSWDASRDWLSLGQLARLISDPQTATWLKRMLTPTSWFLTQLPAILDELAEVRNQVAHGYSSPERPAVALWRAQLLGVGCHGHLIQLGTMRIPRSAGRQQVSA